MGIMALVPHDNAGVKISPSYRGGQNFVLESPVWLGSLSSGFAQFHLLILFSANSLEKGKAASEIDSKTHTLKTCNDCIAQPIKRQQLTLKGLHCMWKSGDFSIQHGSGGTALQLANWYNPVSILLCLNSNAMFTPGFFRVQSTGWSIWIGIRIDWIRTL